MPLTQPTAKTAAAKYPPGADAGWVPIEMTGVQNRTICVLAGALAAARCCSGCRHHNVPSRRVIAAARGARQLTLSLTAVADSLSRRSGGAGQSGQSAVPAVRVRAGHRGRRGDGQRPGRALAAVQPAGTSSAPLLAIAALAPGPAARVRSGPAGSHPAGCCSPCPPGWPSRSWSCGPGCGRPGDEPVPG